MFVSEHQCLHYPWLSSYDNSLFFFVFFFQKIPKLFVNEFFICSPTTYNYLPILSSCINFDVYALHHQVYIINSDILLPNLPTIRTARRGPSKPINFLTNNDSSPFSDLHTWTLHAQFDLQPITYSTLVRVEEC